MVRRATMAWVFLLCLMVQSSEGFCEGRLERFEHAVTEEPEESRAAQSRGRERAEDDEDDGCGLNFVCMLGELFVDLTSAVLTGMVETLADDGSRLLDPYPPALSSSEKDDPLGGAIPVSDALMANPPPAEYTPAAAPEEQRGAFGRAAIGYQRLDPRGDLKAFDFDLLAGYGNSALRLRHTHFKQSGALEARLAYSRFDVGAGSFQDEGFNFGLGFGLSRLQGAQTHYGIEMSLPIYWTIGKGVRFNLDSAWSSVGAEGVSDYDAAVSWQGERMELRAGYRWLNGGGERLHGSYAALGLVW